MEDDKDIRASLEEAVAASEEKVNEKPEVVEREAPKEEVKEKAEASPTEEKPAPEVDTPEKKPEVEAKESEEPVKSTLKPPVSWKAGAKERWASLTPDVQEEIVRRERESAVAIQQNAEGRRFAESFQKAIEPYRGIMAAEGAPDAITAVQNLMQTAASLRLGTPVQKADVIARLINYYGVDVQTLDGLLSGQADPKIVQQQELDRLLQEKLAPYQQFMQQQTQQSQVAQQRIKQQAAQVVDDFAQKNEFVDDPEVSNTMADLLEVAAKRGRSMSIQEAYDRAVQMTPEVAKILEQRKAAASVTDIERARAASSSVKGSPMGGGAVVAGDSIRDSLEAAFNRKI